MRHTTKSIINCNVHFMYYTNCLHILLFLCTIALLNSCATQPSSQWLKVNDDVALWISSEDTTKNYSWLGGTFDGVANGNGTLIVIDEEGNETSTSINMFYGASTNDDIVKLDDGSKYVGKLESDMMEGYGVLSKDNDLYIGQFHNSKPNGFLKWYKSNKIYYEGFWKDGEFHGEGTLYKDGGSIKSGTWENGTLTQSFIDKNLPNGHYKGYVKKGKPDGLGQMTYSNGGIYQGNWKDGLFSGEGLYINSNDSVYGTWSNGKINGDVIYKTNTLTFEGTFIDNMPIGIGNLTTNDGTFYSGSWLDGKRDGMGDMIFANGDKYSGDWENNFFDGYGVFHYSKANAVYRGDWSKGLQNGYGSYRCPDFSYDGEWDSGWMDGKGVLSFKNGDVYDGTLHENLIDGIGCYTYANGNRYEGEFVQGKMTGLGRFQFKNGNRFEGEFYGGKIYGDGTMYIVNKSDTVAITGFWPIDGSFPKEASIMFPNGDLYEGPLANGMPTNNGIWISGEERKAKIDAINNSLLHKANELYKKHREAINWCLLGASAVVTAVEVAAASTGIGLPIAVVAHGINIGINVADAGLSITSALIDVKENYELGEDNTEALTNLATEVGMNAAFILVPKVVSTFAKPLGKAVKNVTRSMLATNVLKAGRFVAKQSTIKLLGKKTFGKVIKISFSEKKGYVTVVRTIERTIYKTKAGIALGRMLTKSKNQIISHSTYLKKIKANPELAKKLKLSPNGSSKNLGDNMRLCGHEKWVSKNERIRKYLGLPKRQIEPHHIIPSNPVTEEGRQARNIWVKFFSSVDHPCNGIWLGRGKGSAYKALAKGSNHGPNSNEYERYVAQAVIKTYKKYQKKYANNPEMMQKLLEETVDNVKGQIFKGKLAVGSGAHEVHTALSIFTNEKNIIMNVAQKIIEKMSHLK